MSFGKFLLITLTLLSTSFVNCRDEPAPTHAFDCVNHARITLQRLQKIQKDGDNFDQEEKDHLLYDWVFATIHVCRDVDDIDHYEYCYEVTQKLAKFTKYMAQDLIDKDYDMLKIDRDDFYSWMKDAYVCDKSGEVEPPRVDPREEEKKEEKQLSAKPSKVSCFKTVQLLRQLFNSQKSTSVEIDLADRIEQAVVQCGTALSTNSKCKRVADDFVHTARRAFGFLSRGEFEKAKKQFDFLLMIFVNFEEC